MHHADYLVQSSIIEFTVIKFLFHLQQGACIGLYAIFIHFRYLGRGSSMIVNVGRFCALFAVIHNHCRLFIDFLCRSYTGFGQDLGKVKLVSWLIYKTYVPVNLTGTYISLLMKFILLIYICASQSIFLSKNLLVNNRKKVKNINWHIYSI